MGSLKVFNLTDVATPLLEEHEAIGLTFAVGRLLLAPGQSGETVDDAMTRMHLSHFIAIGAAAVDKIPPEYIVAKKGSKKSAPPLSKKKGTG